MEKTNYKGWQNCCRISNGLVDLVVTTDVGPRIIRFGFVGEENESKEYGDMVGETGGAEWRIYGGHRLWHAPEARPRTYYPDNLPVELEEHAGFVRMIQPTETTTGIQKEIDIRLSTSEAHVELTQRLRNTNLWAVELAPWALSVMANGGRILHHLRHNLWRKECSVIFVGYQAIGTPGRAIVDGARSIRMFGEEVAVRARACTINGLSAHADQRGLVDWLRPTEKADVRLVHGEPKSLEGLAAAIRTELGRKVSIAAFAEGYEV